MNILRGSAGGHLAALAAACLFGLMSPVCKVAMGSGVVDGPALATMRVCGSACMFWLVSLCMPGQRIRRRDWPALMAMSLCGMALNQFLYVTGVQYTSPTNGCVIGTSTPIMALLLSAVFLKMRITRQRAIGIGLACCGALFLLLGSAHGAGGHLKGDVYCLCSQVAAACYFVFFGRLIRRYRVVTLMKWLFTISSLVVLPVFGPHLAGLDWPALGITEGVSCIYVVAIGTFVCYLLLNVGQSRLAPPVVAAYNYVQPVVAATAGILWGVDELTWQKVLAILLIAGGVLLVSSRKSKAL
ncbi:MAG: DMT family transporter [Akkermansia sp.]|nr:DMT family transporter [Akkermansia sp.]